MIRFLSFILPLGLYFFTTPSVVPFGDAGEFVIAACDLGVPHPPGFPIYVLVGKLFCLIPFDTPVFRISFMSGFFGALTCLMVYSSLTELKLNRWIGFLAALSLATSNYFWEVSRIAEVYTLHTFLASTIFYLCTCYGNRGLARDRNLIFLVMGLAFAHHWPLLILVSPTYLILLLKSKKENMNSWLKSSLYFFVGLAPYLLIPIYSMGTPDIDWGHTTTLNNFLGHITRQTTGLIFLVGGWSQQ